MRKSGILMPIFSLPSDYGIGTLGKEAYKFVDFLKNSGQSLWQILPLGVTGFGNSPYQSVSSYAGNPNLIDFELLVDDGLLEFEDFKYINWGDDPTNVDYDKIEANKLDVLKIAFNSFKENKEYYLFLEENSFWLEDYALYCSIKKLFNAEAYQNWPEGYKRREASYIEKAKIDLDENIKFHYFVQFVFFKQWQSLKKYANDSGISIVGDIPIYVADDSADVWSNTKQFLLDDDFKPKAVAGCPPDVYSKDGQLWGNPLYNWDYMKSDNFTWWINRIQFSTRLYDVIRIDHFRAFSAYYSIPNGEKTAKNGKWIKGPGEEIFDALEKTLGKLNIIAEDLGTIDDDVKKLLGYTGFPGMKVLQFAFDTNSESSYLPHNIEKNCVVYTGTHDNDTIIGYMKNASEKEINFVKNYLRISDNDSFNWAMIKSAMATNADTVIFQMQDFLGLDNSARMNTPSTVKNNWQWRIAKGCTNEWLAKIIYDITKLYFRLPEQKNSL